MTINYGLFLNSIISFLIVAFAVFMLVYYINRMRREEKTEAVEPTTRECPYCLSTIPIKASCCPQCTSELKP